MVERLFKTSKARFVACLACLAAATGITSASGQQPTEIRPAETSTSGTNPTGTNPAVASAPQQPATSGGFGFSDGKGVSPRRSSADTPLRPRTNDDTLRLTIDGTESARRSNASAPQGFSFTQPANRAPSVDTPASLADDFPTAKQVGPLRSLLDEPAPPATTIRSRSFVQRPQPSGQPSPVAPQTQLNPAVPQGTPLSEAAGAVTIAEFGSEEDAPTPADWAFEPAVETPPTPTTVPAFPFEQPTVELTPALTAAAGADVPVPTDVPAPADAAVAADLDWSMSPSDPAAPADAAATDSVQPDLFWLPNAGTFAAQPTIDPTSSSDPAATPTAPAADDTTLAAEQHALLVATGLQCLLLPTTLDASQLTASLTDDAATTADATPTELFMPAQSGPEIVFTNVGTAKPETAALLGDSSRKHPLGPLRPSHPIVAIETTVDEQPAELWLPAEPTTVTPGKDERYLQTAALFDDDLRSFSAGPVLPAGDDESNSTADESAAERAEEGETSREDGTIGEAPQETNDSLQFLRRQTILLKPGEFQFDVTLSYLNDANSFPILLTNGTAATAPEVVDGVPILVTEGRTRQRLLSLPLDMRVGLTENTQLFVNVPFGWSYNEVAFNGRERTKEEGGIGDVSAGLTHQVVIGNEYYPDVLANLSFSAPSGNSSLSTALGTPGSSLGQGFWTLTASLSFIQTYDPIVFFYGAGYTFRFENTFANTIEIDPGDQIFYRFGAGFAVNPHVTLSAAFTGSFITRDEVNGRGIAGSIREPMSVRLAATISRKENSKTHSSFKLVEPFVNFGLNEDSIDSFVGISWTY